MGLSKPLLLFSSNANNSTDSSHHYHDHDDDHDEDPGDDDGGYDVLGVVAALAVPIISACIGIIVRPVKHVHYSVLLFWVGVGGVIVSIIGIISSNNDAMFHNWNIRQWILSFMVAVLSILGSIMMIKAV